MCVCVRDMRARVADNDLRFILAFVWLWRSFFVLNAFRFLYNQPSPVNRARAIYRRRERILEKVVINRKPLGKYHESTTHVILTAIRTQRFEFFVNLQCLYYGHVGFFFDFFFFYNFFKLTIS